MWWGAPPGISPLARPSLPPCIYHLPNARHASRCRSPDSIASLLSLTCWPRALAQALLHRRRPLPPAPISSSRGSISNREHLHPQRGICWGTSGRWVVCHKELFGCPPPPQPPPPQPPSPHRRRRQRHNRWYRIHLRRRRRRRQHHLGLHHHRHHNRRRRSPPPSHATTAASPHRRRHHSTRFLPPPPAP